MFKTFRSVTEIITGFDAPKTEAAGIVTPTLPHRSKLLVCRDPSQLRATRCTANCANRQLVATALVSDRKKKSTVSRCLASGDMLLPSFTKEDQAHG